MAAGTLVSLADAAKNGMNDPRLLGEWLAVAWSREVEPELAVRAADGPRYRAVAFIGEHSLLA